MSIERIQGTYSAIVIFFLLSFIGFSILVFGGFGEAYALAGFGLFFILAAAFVFRARIPKAMLIGSLIGGTGGALIGWPVGIVMGEYLSLVYGVLTAAIWGIIVALVLFIVFAKYLLSILPYNVQNVLFMLVIFAGVIFGIIGFKSTMGEIYGPVNGPILIGWTAGMTAGLILGFNLSTDSEQNYERQENSTEGY